MEKTILISALLAVLVIGSFLFLFSGKKILEFDDIVLRELPSNAIIVEKDISVSKRIKQLYNEGQLFVFEGIYVTNQKHENEAFQQAANKARQELSTFLGAKISSDANLKEKMSGIREAFGYSQDVNIVVNNFVSSSKIIAKWKVPQGKGVFEYHVLVYYDPDLFNTFVKEQKKKQELYHIVIDLETRSVIKNVKIDNFESIRQEFERAKKIGDVITLEVVNGKINAKEKAPILYLLRNARLKDGRYRGLYYKTSNKLILFVFREAK
ncbi:hypothetical protein SU69_04155 [Thermosipho melanesiensis]|uniref:Uncharacterized protein n=2 Tax=Thermosipho melanesiensis TaxID=46541 RepID=A6LL74_THEM4|nr:hypothetical protein [Thermosipho melanesiensis]ABR30675.1 hypothetical protein Tmel_0814 [Thermosipho melanesiensis BI429]APT73807.1 hypothetical protein BW47_04385 [Thermosipho melanesiensis]OOC35746.1 hypothetical protein SU68_04210 [Thermosipho melanesiensis]OOC39045.1 hypothetical protein SU69_04155 [Thermosipho melanesiensis]OOC39193.1 hypothetical protein SU70_04155 [Thermosipho melanesiensis]